MARTGCEPCGCATAEPDPRALADFCADLALHDWLLSALLDIVDRAVARSRPAAELIGMLRPGIDHLVHAWMPAAHVSRTLDRIWQELDLRSGFSLQWQKTVERIRDQLSVGVIEALRPFHSSRRDRRAHDQRRNKSEPCTGNHHEDRVSPAHRIDYARVAADAGGMPGRNSLALTAVVTFGSALVLFIVDTEIRLSAR